MKKQSALLFVLVFTATTATLGAESKFRFRKELDRAVTTGEELLAVVLDRDIYAATREGFPDLRIRDDSGREVPFVLQQVGERRTKMRREVVASEVVSLHEVDGKSIEILVRLGDKAPNASGLTFHTPLADYEHRVKVSVSLDGKEWTQLVSDGLIFDYGRFMDIHNRDVTLPTNAFRQFKIIVEQVEDELESPYRVLTRGQRKSGEEKKVETTTVTRRQFRIDKLETWRTVEVEGDQELQKKRYPIGGFTVEQQPRSDKTSLIRVRTHREPLTRFILEVGNKNFSRAATVRVLVKRGVESKVGGGTVYRIQFRDFRREELRLEFSEHREEQLTIEVENQDSPLLEITGVKAEGNIYRLVFLGSARHRYHIEYGSETAESPQYDTAAVLASLGPGFKLEEVSLGGQIKNPRHIPKWSLQELLNRPIVLTTAIILMVVVLCWVLVRAGKMVKQIPEDAAGGL